MHVRQLRDGRYRITLCHHVQPYPDDEERYDLILKRFMPVIVSRETFVTKSKADRYSQTYTFYTTTDDGVRRWVNGVEIVNKWKDQGASKYSSTITLLAGQRYSIKMEYYENTGQAVAQLSWSSG